MCKHIIILKKKNNKIFFTEKRNFGKPFDFLQENNVYWNLGQWYKNIEIGKKIKTGNGTMNELKQKP